MSSIEGIHSGGIEEGNFREEITKADWERIEEDLADYRYDHGAQVNLSSFLASRGYSNTIRDIKINRMNLREIDVSNCHFVNCEIKGMNFSLGTFQNVTFSKCNLEGTYFYAVKASELNFYDCDLSYTCWNEAELNNLTIEGSDHASPFQTNSKNSLEGMTFISAKVTGQSSIQNCFLDDIIFGETQPQFSIVNCTPHTIKRPVVGIGLNPLSPASYALSGISAIRKFGGIPVILHHYPREIDSKSLNDAVYKTLRNYPDHCNLSRAQWLLKNPKNEHIIERIKGIAQHYFSSLDGLVIPGGDDVPEILYNKVEEKKGGDSEELVRSVFEFALLELCEQKKKPAMGICRGCQIMNVFLGGTLSNISPKDGPLKLGNLDSKELEPLKSYEPFTTFLEKIKKEEELYALSAHHQAIDHLGATVVPLLFLRDIIKFSLAREGLFILSQVHPEVIVYEKTVEDQFFAKKTFFQDLKFMIENLDETFRSDSNKEKLTESLKMLLKSFQFDKDEDEEFIAELLLMRIVRNENIYPFLLENQKHLCDRLDKVIRIYESEEKQFVLMMNFSKHVFNLFFEKINLSLLNSEEKIA